jgi:hypothetical protein
MLESSGSGHCTVYQRLADAFSDSMTWEWDDRFGGVLAAFEEGEKDRVAAVLATHFSQACDGATINDAPDEVSDAMARFGGLHPGQLLYHSKLNRNLISLGLWWPWSNGTTISIRFIPHSVNGAENEIEELRAAMPGIFGLAAP